MACIFLKGNEACQRSYQRPCTAHIDANQKSTGILREAAEQNGGRDIADDPQVSAEIRMVPWDKRRAKQYPNSFHPGKVAEKVKKQRKWPAIPIYSFQRMSV